MPLPTGVEIVSITQTPYLRANRTVGSQTNYTYTVGKYGPFTLTLVGEEDTADNLSARIQAQVEKLRAAGVSV